MNVFGWGIEKEVIIDSRNVVDTAQRKNTATRKHAPNQILKNFKVYLLVWKG